MSKIIAVWLFYHIMQPCVKVTVLNISISAKVKKACVVTSNIMPLYPLILNILESKRREKFPFSFLRFYIAGTKYASLLDSWHFFCWRSVKHWLRTPMWFTARFPQRTSPELLKQKAHLLPLWIIIALLWTKSLFLDSIVYFSSYPLKAHKLC